jgi:hypothetical protein
MTDAGIYKLEKYDEVIRKSDGVIFYYKGRSSVGFAHIIVEDMKGIEHRVYGPDFDSVQDLLDQVAEPEERATTYEFNDHRAIQVLIAEIISKEGGIVAMERTQKECPDEEQVRRYQAHILSDKKQIEELRQGLKWIMEKLQG